MPPTRRARRPTHVQFMDVCQQPSTAQLETRLQAVQPRPLETVVAVALPHVVSVTMTYALAWDLRAVSPHWGVGATPFPFFMCIIKIYNV